MAPRAAEAETLATLLAKQAAERGGAPAIREKRRGIWRGIGWDALAEEAAAIAAGLDERGVARGGRIALIGENRPRLYAAMAAAHRLGVAAVPLFPETPADEIAGQLRAVAATAVFAEDQEQVDKILEILPACPTVGTIIYDDDRGMRHYRQPQLVAHDDLVARGRELMGGAGPAVGADDVSADAEAFVFFTSGADGAPKAASFSHRAMIGRARAAVAADGLGHDDKTLAIFPPGSMCQTLFGYVHAMVAGHCICCPEAQDTLLEDMREIAPTYLLTTPRMLDAIVSQVSLRMEDTGGMNLRLYRNALALAKRVGRRRLEGRAPAFGDRIMSLVYEALIYAPLRDALGMSRVRSAYSTGDRLDPAMLAFFRALGINLKQVYGLTETGFFVAMHRDGEVRPETVGAPLGDIELTFGPGQEILVRGPGLMSAEPGSGGQAADGSGWLHTGDAGFLDERGELRLIDRLDAMGKLADGTTFAPRQIEARLRVSPHVREAVVFGDGRDEVCALVDIDTLAVGRWADGHEIPYMGHLDLASQDAVYGFIGQWISEVNADLASDPQTAPLQIRRFVLLPQEMSAEDGMLTRTGKLRRQAIAERFGPLVEALYSGESEVSLERAADQDGLPGPASTVGLKIREATVVGAAVNRRAA